MQDGGMSLWSRLRFMIDFDDDEISLPPPAVVVVSTGTIPPAPVTPITPVPFDKNLRQAIDDTIAYYQSPTSTSLFKTRYTTKPSTSFGKKTSSSGGSKVSEELAADIASKLVVIDATLASKETDIVNLMIPLIKVNAIASALFTSTVKNPITAMEPVLVAQLCNDKLKNAINNDTTIGITVADGQAPRRKKPTTRKSRGRKSRSPNSR
jgi:hypothetical protein